MEDMMGGEGALGKALHPAIEGWVMIMLADMIVRWGEGLGMLTKGLMAGTWVDHLVAIKAVHRVIGIQSVVVIVMLPM